MRLGEWRASATGKKVIPAKVADVLESALHALGVPADPVAYVLWGDQPEVRFLVFAASDAGLAYVAVRVNVPQEGPRASGRLIRWSRVQTGEFSVEAHHGHRQVTAQVESQVLQGVDAAGDEIAAWMGEVYRRVDGVATGQVRA
jgi:hypothetical protein